MFKKLILSALLLLLTMTAFAQGAPAQIEDALKAFNAQIGQNLTLNDFNWTWEQNDYPDSSLGCPQPGQSYAQGVIVSYRFLFTWNNEIYDYRVSADRTLVVFCGKIPVATETPGAPVIDKSLSNSLCPAPTDLISYIHTRLTPNIQGRVLAGSPNNLRADANATATLVGEIPAGATFDVLAGPSCDAEGYVWWQVSYNGLTGWTAEGRGADYFVEPLPPTAELPATLAVLTTGNAGLVGELARLQGNYGDSLAWSRNNEIVTVGAAGSEGAWIYPATQLTIAPRTLPDDALLSDIAFSAAENFTNVALFGDNHGDVRLWDIASGAGLVERAFLEGHDDPVTAVTFSPDGTLLASSGGYAYLSTQEDSNNYAIVLWDVDVVSQIAAMRGHTGDVVDLAFSADGTKLASASADGSVRLWNVADGSQLNTLQGEVGATNVVFSPDGSKLVTGWADGAIITISLTNGFTSASTLTGHTGGVNDLAISPDGSLLASVGEDGRVLLWDANILTAQTLIAVEPIEMPAAHNGATLAVTFNPYGTVFATLGADNTIRLWGVVSNQG